MHRWGLAFILMGGAVFGQAPPVAEPFDGDPRLEPIPSSPIHLPNFAASAGGQTLSMRFPPRVNGQVQSDGDGHSDLYVLFRDGTGAFVNQPLVVERAPKGAAAGVSDLSARLFSPVRQVYAVLMDPAYNPSDLGQRIDSAAEVYTSPLVRRIYQTNIFLNAPALPNGSTVASGAAPPLQVFFNGQLVTIAPGDVADGIFFPQILFRIEDAGGNLLGPPFLIASRSPGQTFFSPIWDVWTIRLPAATRASSIRTLEEAQATGATIHSAGIRVNAPVVAVNGQPVPVENWFALLTVSGNRFDPAKFPFDVSRTSFKPQRTLRITKVETPGQAPPDGPGDFPAIDPGGRGNVIPIILQDPFQLPSSSPGATGPIARIDQAELDAAFLNNSPPRLPAAIEANISALVNAGLLTADWLPGGRPYQERLAAVGRALFELQWQPEQGASLKDVVTCQSCHSLTGSGGAARALFTLQRGGPETRSNAGSMWGSGAAELLIQQKLAAGETGVTFAHGSRGFTSSVRRVLNGASDTHFGIQTAEFVARELGNPNGFDAVTDLDGDGVANEQSVGEVTAETAFLLTLPVPDQASSEALEALGISPDSVAAGRSLFRRLIDEGGAGCASCHRPFHTLTGDTYLLRNPQTAAAIPLQMPHHRADADDVAEGLAAFVGQMGLRTWGDYRRHKMGSRMTVGGNDVFKTAELWDAGSVAPYGAGGAFDGSLDAAIRAHEGVGLEGLTEIGRSQQFDVTVESRKLSVQFVAFRNTSGAIIPASASAPVRIVLTGSITPGVRAANAASPAPGGGLRHGAVWLIVQNIPPGQNATVTLVFDNPLEADLAYSLTPQDHAGFSESAASAQAYAGLSADDRSRLIDFLRAQLIRDAPAEGAN